MNITDFERSFAVWVDESRKIISFKEDSNGKIVYFENKDKGLEFVTELVSKGYKIG